MHHKKSDCDSSAALDKVNLIIINVNTIVMVIVIGMCVFIIRNIVIQGV